MAEILLSAAQKPSQGGVDGDESLQAGRASLGKVGEGDSMKLSMPRWNQR
jgi:hypothetical protein